MTLWSEVHLSSSSFVEGSVLTFSFSTVDMILQAEQLEKPYHEARKSIKIPAQRARAPIGSKVVAIGFVLLPGSKTDVS